MVVSKKTSDFSADSEGSTSTAASEKEVGVGNGKESVSLTAEQQLATEDTKSEDGNSFNFEKKAMNMHMLKNSASSKTQSGRSAPTDDDEDITTISITATDEGGSGTTTTKATLPPQTVKRYEVFFGVFYGPSSEDTKSMHEKRATSQVFSNVGAKKAGSGYEDCTQEVHMNISKEKFVAQYKRIKGNVYFECFDFCGRKKWLVD